MNAECSTEAVSAVLADADLARGLEIRYPLRNLPYPLVVIICDPFFPASLRAKVTAALRSEGHEVVMGAESGEEFLLVYEDPEVLDMMRALDVKITPAGDGR